MTDKEKLEKIKELADAMYYAAQHLTTDASGLHKAMDEYHQFIINEYHKEEPVSEDLEEAIGKYCSNPDNFATWIGGDETDDIRLIIKAIEYGANWQKQQMMKDAIDTIVKVDAGGYPYVDRTIELYDYDEDIPLAKGGDKVKIVVINED